MAVANAKCVSILTSARAEPRIDASAALFARPVDDERDADLRSILQVSLYHGCQQGVVYT